jgi:hypothetical protein
MMATVAVSGLFKEGDLTDIFEYPAEDESSIFGVVAEASPAYGQKERWAHIFAYGNGLSAKYAFTEDEVLSEIRKHRTEKNGA